MIQEIVKYHESKDLKFTGGNNRPGSLLLMPLLKSIKRYDNIFLNHESMIDLSINISPKILTDALMMRLPNASLEILFKFKESFATIAIEKVFLLFSPK